MGVLLKNDIEEECDALMRRGSRDRYHKFPPHTQILERMAYALPLTLHQEEESQGHDRSRLHDYSVESEVYDETSACTDGDATSPQALATIPRLSIPIQRPKINPPVAPFVHDEEEDVLEDVDEDGDDVGHGTTAGSVTTVATSSQAALSTLVQSKPDVSTPIENADLMTMEPAVEEEIECTSRMLLQSLRSKVLEAALYEENAERSEREVAVARKQGQRNRSGSLVKQQQQEYAASLAAALKEEEEMREKEEEERAEERRLEDPEAQTGYLILSGVVRFSPISC